VLLGAFVVLKSAPHLEQNWDPSGFCVPQLLQYNLMMRGVFLFDLNLSRLVHAFSQQAKVDFAQTDKSKDRKCLFLDLRLKCQAFLIWTRNPNSPSSKEKDQMRGQEL
jgi:hypothetical protein